MLSEHPLLIGQLLARAQRREARRQARSQFLLCVLCVLCGKSPQRRARTNIARISPTETIYSPGR